MLRTRIITAVILVTILLGALFVLPERGWVGFTFAIALVALWEWARIAQLTGQAGYIFLVASCLVGLALLAAFVSPEGGAAGRTGAYAQSVGFIAAAIFWIVCAPLWLALAWHPHNRLILAATGWVIIFPTWFALITFHAYGRWYLLALMAVIWVADIAAYFAGRAFGKHKLAPTVSPGKTWEGVAGALLGVLVYAALCMAALKQFGGEQVQGINLETATLVVAFLALALLSVIGDLFESWMKRGAGLKDSSNLLPGHGGVLDRIDALTSTLPTAPLIFLAVQRLVS
jgi:phosphatidate cytidylyltransferase